MSEMTRGVDGDRMAALFVRCLHLHAETSGGVSTFSAQKQRFQRQFLFCSSSFEWLR